MRIWHRETDDEGLAWGRLERAYVAMEQAEVELTAALRAVVRDPGGPEALIRDAGIPPRRGARRGFPEVPV
jgi:hypothetical protein